MEQLLLKLAYSTFRVFWPLFLATSALCVIWVVRNQAAWKSGRPFVLVDRGSGFVLAVAMPMLILALIGADFAYWDNEIFLTNTVEGRNAPLAIFPLVGRYFPLGHIEWNLVAFIGATPIVYHGFLAAQLVVFCLTLNLLMNGVGLVHRVLATVLVLWPSGTAIAFTDAVIDTDRNVIFFLAIFLAAVMRFDAAPSRLNLLVALLSAHLAVYYRETVFLLFATFAVTRLAFLPPARSEGLWPWMRTRPLEVGVLAVCGVFVVQLMVSLLASIATPYSSYVGAASVGALGAARRFLQTDPALWVFIVGLCLRAFRGFGARNYDKLWDSGAVAALLYLAATVATGLAQDRYMGPVNLLGVLFTLRQIEALSSRHRAIRPWTIATAGVLAAVAVTSGTYRIAAHHSVTFGTARLADFVASRAQESPDRVRLFFPDSTNARIMHFAGYLRYRHGDVFPRVHFLTPRDTPDGMCVGYQSLRCEHAERAEPGDLIVQLGDDATRSGSRDALVLQTPLLPTRWLGPLGRVFYPQEPLFGGSPQPEGWLETTVAGPGVGIPTR